LWPLCGRLLTVSQQLLGGRPVGRGEPGPVRAGRARPGACMCMLLMHLRARAYCYCTYSTYLPYAHTCIICWASAARCVHVYATRTHARTHARARARAPYAHLCVLRMLRMHACRDVSRIYRELYTRWISARYSIDLGAVTPIRSPEILTTDSSQICRLCEWEARQSFAAARRYA
jgi:hypothetical protein